MRATELLKEVSWYLLSEEQKVELKACIKAFKGVRVGKLVWNCHHTTEIERLNDNPYKRMAFIVREKLREEIATRLKNFRPVSQKTRKMMEEASGKNRLPRYSEDIEDVVPAEAIKIAHDMDVPDHDWDSERGRLVFRYKE